MAARTSRTRCAGSAVLCTVKSRFLSTSCGSRACEQRPFPGRYLSTTVGTAVISSTLLSDYQEISTSVRYRLQHRVQVPFKGLCPPATSCQRHHTARPGCPQPRLSTPELWNEGCPMPRALTLTPVSLGRCLSCADRPCYSQVSDPHPPVSSTCVAV